MASLRYRGHYGGTAIRIESLSDSALEALLQSHGNSVRKMGKAIKRSPHTIADLLHARGIRWKPDSHRRLLASLSGPALSRVFVESRMNRKEAAERLGVHPFTVYKEMAARGLKASKPGRRKTLLTRHFLERWHRTHGVPLRVIAQRLGIGKHAVYERMYALGLRANVYRPVIGPYRGRAMPMPFTKPWDFDLSPAEIEKAEMERVLAAAASRAEAV